MSNQQRTGIKKTYTSPSISKPIQRGTRKPSPNRKASPNRRASPNRGSNPKKTLGNRDDQPQSLVSIYSKPLPKSTTDASTNPRLVDPHDQKSHRMGHYEPKPIPSKMPGIGNHDLQKLNTTPYKFTPAEIEKLRHGFSKIDVDGNGSIEKEEMNFFLMQNGIDTTFTDLAFQLFSANGETLNFEEFQKYISITTQMDDNPRVFYKCLFDFIDKDHSGGIDQDELMEFCRLCKNPISKAEAKKTIQELDDAHTGTIHFNDLCKYLGV
ncbi:Rhomboid- protein 3 [Tritrichomonas musculus]|uniref:Rhomboid- protein 3 n=1 Tax=Tritrichomonas musculus TaxID=1915356 RepID=A0ABR2JS30_9EUKA